MTQQIHRGYYGPVPLALVPASKKVLCGARARIAAWLAACVPDRCEFESVDKNQAVVLDACNARLSYPMWRPSILPRGYEVISAEPATVMGDAAIIKLRERGGDRCFEISQRKRWLSIADELSAARVPFTRISLTDGVAACVAHGRFGGEPIDLSFLMTRQTVLFERGDLVVEFRESRVDGPGLLRLLRFARAVVRTAIAHPLSFVDS